MTLKGILSTFVAGTLVVAVTAPVAHAQFVSDKDQRKCLETIAKEGGKYIKARLKELTKCADKNLKDTGSCDFAKRDEKLDKAESKLKSGLDKKCGDASKFPLPDLSLQAIGFPGKCQDSNGPPFTNDDLEACIFETHRDAADAFYDLQYGANGSDAVLSFETQTGSADTAKRLQKCQKEIGKNGLKFVQTILKEVQKCRNGIQKGKLTGFLPAACADNAIETKPKEKIDKAETKTRDKIAGKCSDADIDLMDVCNGAATESAATDCIIDTHRDASDNPNPTAPADLIDVEYRTPAVCGDNILNDALAAIAAQGGNDAKGLFPEECDGNDDDLCPGLCGALGGDFPCLCTDIPRMRVVEHNTINGDNGWNGVAHDQPIVEGSGHILDLYDCDGPGGPDTVCTAGPSCELAPHGPCSTDSDCIGGGNFCRKRATATGPHCSENLQQSCTVNGDCPGQLNFCRRTLASTPIPTSAGGVSTCTLNVVAEDIVGTVDVATGAGAVRLRQRAITHLGTVTNQPCPVCGGFCSGAGNEGSPANRELCDVDSDCPASQTCVTDSVCSFGPNIDQPCRPDSPFGGTTTLFGTTSIDCPPPSGQNISGAGLNITTDPRTTDAILLKPSFACTAPGFGGRVCIAGSETGKACLVDSECTGGGAGSCSLQCFCPSTGPIVAQKPNDCQAACRNGANDLLPCLADSECPGGFCQTAACRLDPSDTDSSQEGYCPGGPFDNRCSVTTIKSCSSNADCRPSGSCAFCEADNTETCISGFRQCFINEGITRTGAPGLPTRERASIFCIPGSGNSSVDNGGGFIGPGTTEGAEDVLITGF
jgi:hypothetical protein